MRTTENGFCGLWLLSTPCEEFCKTGTMFHTRQYGQFKRGSQDLGVDPSWLMTTCTRLLLPGDTQMMGLLKVKGDNEQD